MVGPNFRVGKKIGCGNFGELRLGEKGISVLTVPTVPTPARTALPSSSCMGTVVLTGHTEWKRCPVLSHRFHFFILSRCV